MSDQIYLTKDGLAKLQAELDYLINTKRKQVADRIQEAKDLGDLSENAEYSDAKDEQAWLEGRILDLQVMIKNCQIIEPGAGGQALIGIGATVTVKNEAGDEKTYQIVGSQEADPIQGKISNESPIGRAFLGHRVGDIIEYQAPKGTLKFAVVDIR